MQGEDVGGKTGKGPRYFVRYLGAAWKRGYRQDGAAIAARRQEGRAPRPRGMRGRGQGKGKGREGATHLPKCVAPFQQPRPDL